MKIELVIDRLVLDGVAANLDGDAVRVALGRELTRLLRASPPAAIGASAPFAKADMAMPAEPAQRAALGHAVAAALHGVLVPAPAGPRRGARIGAVYAGQPGVSIGSGSDK